MKQILHLSHTDIKFDSRILKEIGSLAKAGYEVSALGVNGNEDTKESKLNPIYNNYSINLKSRKLVFLPKTIRHVISLFELTSKMMYKAIRVRPNLIHCHDTLVLPVGVMLKIIFRSKLIYDAHELESDRNGLTKVQSKLTFWVEKLLWKFVDGLVVVSPSIAHWYRKKIGKKETAVVLNSPVFNKLEEHNNDYLRRRFSIDAESKIFIYVGILGEGRGLDLIVEAFQHEEIKASLVLLGYGDLKKKLENIVRGTSNIYLHDAVPHEEVVSIVSTADFGLCLIQNISLSDYYCLPNKLFEYSFAGIPVLASDFPDIKQLLEDYDIGICCEVNIDSIVSSIKHLQVNGYSFNNKKKPLEELSWAAQEKRIYDLYEKLIGTPGSRQSLY